MSRPPRHRNQGLLGGGLLWQIGFVASLFMICVFGAYEYAIMKGYSENLARTMAMNTLVTLEIFYLLFVSNMNLKSLSWGGLRDTRVLGASIVIVIMGQAAMTYLPWFQRVFDTEAISFYDILLIIFIGLFMFLIIVSEKQIRLHILKKPV